MRKSTKYWLWGSIIVVAINLTFFLFRNYVNEILLLWVVILTPVACLAMYPLASLLSKKKLSRSEKGS
jgi:hypothetical protein